ncbi:MAG: class I SAM-dependent methyltransferase [Sulfurospirillum sp.]
MSINNEEFYLKAYEKYGITAQGVNWNSKESQEVRFEVITDILGKDIKRSKIVDAGCGFGELYAYWMDRRIFPKKYVGLDCVKNSIEVVKKRFVDLSFACKDVLKDELPLADWYVASGSLNVLSSFDTWLFLEKILESSKKGIVFNILQGYVKSKNFNYQTKDDIKEFAKQKGLEYFIVDGYLKNDMTVKVIK